MVKNKNLKIYQIKHSVRWQLSLLQTERKITKRRAWLVVGNSAAVHGCLHPFFINFTSGICLTAHNATAIFRYIYIFHFWLAGGVDQELTGRFITVTNTVLQAFISAIYVMAPGEDGGDFNRCAGMMQQSVQNSSIKVNR